MSITDELRKYAQDWRENPNLMDDLDAGDIDGLLGDFEHIADRIDAEHEAMLVDARKTVYQGYVELPKDADGEYIHAGDVMEWVDIDGEVTVTCTVEAVGVGCFFAWDNANGRFAQKCANAYRHYHAPSVEDVLREFAYGLGVPVADSYVAATAAKLRLAEGEDA